ncbi:MAG: hypothetical protein GY754_20165 [bacterium]|nr:hypothetical protein [bacterium]
MKKFVKFSKNLINCCLIFMFALGLVSLAGCEDGGFNETPSDNVSPEPEPEDVKDFDGNVRIRENGNLFFEAMGNDAGDIIFQDSDGNQKGRIWTSADTGSGLHLSSGDNTADIVISDSGNVGIGTTNPTHKLTVNINDAGLDNGLLVRNSSDSIATIPNAQQGQGNGLVQNGDKVIMFSEGALNTGNLVIAPWVSGYAGMRITNTGYIGIGTVNPTSILHVSGNGGFGGIISTTNTDTAKTWYFGTTSSNFFTIAQKGVRDWLMIQQDTGLVSMGGNLSVAGTITSVNGTCASDIRFKKNITPLSGAMEKVLLLNGVYYNWRVNKFKNRNFGKDRQIGFIAQNVEKVLPELVHTDTKGYKSVAYNKVTAVLVEAVKEQHRENIVLNQESIELRKASVELRKESAALRRETTALKKENELLKEKVASIDRLLKKVAGVEKIAVK